MKSPFVLSLAALGVTLLLPLGAARAQQSNASTDALPGGTNAAPASPDELSQAIAQKQAEIAALKQQLEDAKRQVKDLAKQNKELQSTDATLRTTQNAAAPSAPPRPPPVPLIATPDKAAPISSMDLFAYFHDTPDTANQYLLGKRIAVNGRLIGFQGPIVRRVFEMHLETGDPNLRIVCKFDIPSVYSSIFLRRQTGEVIGMTPGGGNDVLLKLNDVITVEGKCDGLDDGDVALSRCRLVQ